MDLINLQRHIINNLCDINNNNQITQLLVCDRLAIYRHDFEERLIHALILNYPVCNKITGKVFFRALCVEYLKQYRSTSFSLNDYGAELADFIASYPYAKQLPYLSDVARLEWYYHRTAIGVDVTPSDWQAFASIPADQQAEIFFQLPINSYLIQSQFPLQEIWQVNQEKYSGDYQVDWEASENYFFIWRKDFNVSIEKLTAPEWNLLTAIAQKKTLAELSEQDLQIEILLPQLISKGWVSDFEL